ncbi:hypothetical protein UNSW2_1716 [Campylobacter concisus UNSW2]|uniref:Uncharacterized protein n=1 Tax=Campylobacter concisus UNSW2 TaxID=1242965 RepID=U2FMZ3_9BACT|nr:hypothetical protein UNSW2_1716 [Campylobacter concisus UNSW2]
MFYDLKLKKCEFLNFRLCVLKVLLDKEKTKVPKMALLDR